MSRIAIFSLLVVAPLLAIVLALLGIKTLPAVPLGWFLVLVGVAYPAGLLIVWGIRRRRFWESTAGGVTTREEQGDRSYWLITAGMVLAFYLPPVEYLYLAAVLPRVGWMPAAGIFLVCLGVVLFVWARRTLGPNYSGHVSVKSEQSLVRSGPYRFIRHPAYAGFLLMALGLCLGYSSLTGLGAVLALLVPGLVYRMRVEEKLLVQHFGDAYREYRRTTRRLIPGIW